MRGWRAMNFRLYTALMFSASRFIVSFLLLDAHGMLRGGETVGSLRIKGRIHHRQLLIKDLAVLQVLAVEGVTAGKER
jgi:hypothetical protein